MLPAQRNSKVVMPRLNNANIPILWTNNNNEAYNNVITQDQNWAVLKLPAFIDKLQELDSDQTISNIIIVGLLKDQELI
jgi:hypothetical protein